MADVAYTVTPSAFSPSWPSELVVSFGGSGVPQVYLKPGIGVDDVSVGPDGIQRLQFYETVSARPEG